MASTAHAMFEQTARRHPESLAIVDGTCSMSYGDLDAAAEQVAERLRAAGVCRGDIVGVLADRSAAAVAAVIGVLKSGGAFLPLDPHHPAARLCELVAAGRVAHVVADRPPPVELGQVTVIPVEAVPVVGARVTAPRADAVATDDLAYVIFTSGSTGTPKAVLVEHRSLVNLCRWHHETYAVTPADRVSQSAGLTFDASVWEIFSALTSGASLHLVPDDVRRAPVALLRWLTEHRITAAFIATALLDALCGPHQPEPGPDLRLVLTGGDRLRGIPTGWQARIVNHYGPTEATVLATAYEVTPATPRPIPIGCPVHGVGVTVLGPDGEPCRDGEVGELVITGVGVARGYLGHSPGTGAFAPLASRQGPVRAYRTGDLGRRRPDGLLEFVGRADSQVKISGIRIEPAEIEKALARVPAVATAVVTAEQAPGGRLELVAHIVPRPGNEGTLTPATCRAALLQMLPPPLVPRWYLPLDAVPVTANGKVDRATLTTRWTRERAASVAGVVGNAASAWRDATGQEPTRPDDDFFVAGGDSLGALAAVAEVATGDTADALGAFLAAATFATLVALAGETTGSAPPTSIPPRPSGAPCPVVPTRAQEGLWFIQQFEPASPAYNVPLAWWLDGPVDTAALDVALVSVVAAHPTLRTRFVAGATGLPVLACDEPPPWLLEVVDTGSDDEVLARAMAFVRRPFDLAAERPCRAWYLRRGPARGLLLFVVHHIAFDGSSTAVLVESLERAWRAAVSGCGSSAPGAQPEAPDADDPAALAYWRDALVDAPPALDLPLDRPVRPHRYSTGEGAVETVRLSPAVRSAVRSAVRALGTSEFAVLLTAFAAVLARHAQVDDVVLGVPVAGGPGGRPTAVAFDVHVLPVRLATDRSRPLDELVGHVTERLRLALTQRACSFESIVAATGAPRDPSRHPLFQVAVIGQPRTAPLRLEGVGVRSVRLWNGTAKFDLSLYVFEEPDAVELALEYSTALFDPVRARRLLAHLETLIIAGLGAAVPFGDLAVEPVGELVEGPEAPGLETESLPALFTTQVRSRPDAVAILEGDTTRTYAELDAAADGVATRLRAAGVRPGDTVAVLAARSAATVAVLLGVFKAGAAVLALDPVHPPAHLAQLISAAGVAHVLVDHRTHPGVGGPATTRFDGTVFDRPSGAGDGDDVSAADEVAFVVFTSGSTGTPKGVLVEHRAVVNRLRWGWRDLPFGPDAVTLWRTPVTFVDTIAELFGPLLAGVPVVVAPGSSGLDLDGVADLVVRHEVTHLVVVPTMLAMLLDREDERGDGALRSLRTCVVSGEPCPVELADRVARRLPVTRLVNLYGSTECGGDATWSTLLDGRGGRPGIDAIWGCVAGRPIDGLAVYVLDDRGRPLPPGIDGEITIVGAGLARGYREVDGATSPVAELLPLGPQGTAVPAYRTGDVGRLDDRGRLVVRGRRDRVVNVGGARVGCAEVERALCSCGGVADAVVAPASGPGKRTIEAAVVPEQGSALIGPDVRRAVALVLPAYMVPARVFVAAEAARLTSGKLDRVGTLHLARARALARDREPAPTGAAAGDAVARAWCQVLGLAVSEPEDNFFDVGGSSLVWMELRDLLRTTTALAVPITAVFEAPTLAELTELLLARTSESGAHE